MMLQHKSEGAAALNQRLSAVARGDRASFLQLYRETSPKLFALALRLMRRRDKAEEVLQDAFVKIWTRAGDWDHERGTAMTWMASIVRNRAIDMLRKEVRASVLDSELARESEFTFLAPPHAEVSQDEIDGLRICIDQLERNQRRTVMLAYFEGLTHEELAERLDAPLGTVKSWLRRGLLRLKKCLDNE
jgi:RNA polymerase sigma-70 factor (ECF subfamily)